MTLKFRWTKSGKEKQKKDELAGWDWLEQHMRNPGRAEITNLRGTDDDGQPTIDTNNANYEKWKEAHKRAAKIARQERQRQQAEKRPKKSPETVRPCDVDPDTRVRDTLRVAVVTHKTDMDEGSPLGKSRGQSLGKLVAWIKKALESVDNELAVRSRHSEAHDLRIENAPPKRVFLAPEWFFRPRNSAYTQAQRDEIIEEMVKISRIYPDWLFIPGTIFWTSGDPAHPPYPVFNTVSAYAGGIEMKRHSKANRWDIAQDMLETTQTWGMYTGPHNTATNLMTPQDPAYFLDQGLEWCIDICRDHAVGEAACGYAAHHPTWNGPHVYIVTANGTTVAPRFIAARDDGFLIYCDGAGPTVQVKKIARNSNLSNVTDYLNAYYTEYSNERVSLDQASRLNKEALNLLSAGHGATAKPKVDRLKAAGDTPTNLVEANIKAGATAAAAGTSGLQAEALKEAHWYHEARTRNLTQDGNPLFTNEEKDAMQQYETRRTQEATAWGNFNTRKAAKNTASDDVNTHTNVTATDVTHNGDDAQITVARPQPSTTIAKEPDHVKVFELIDID